MARGRSQHGGVPWDTQGINCSQGNQVLYTHREVMKEKMKNSMEPQKVSKTQELVKLVHEESVHLKDNKFTLLMMLQAKQHYYSLQQHRGSMTKDKF